MIWTSNAVMAGYVFLINRKSNDPRTDMIFCKYIARILLVWVKPATALARKKDLKQKFTCVI